MVWNSWKKNANYHVTKVMLDKTEKHKVKGGVK